MSRAPLPAGPQPPPEVLGALGVTGDPSRLGIVVGDAVAWEGAPPSSVDVWADVPGWYQLLLRAVICRIATRGRNEALGSATTDSAEEYLAVRRPSVELVLSRV